MILKDPLGGHYDLIVIFSPLFPSSPEICVSFDSTTLISDAL